MEPNKNIDLPGKEEDYYKIDRMSNSMMKHFARSPLHYLYAKRVPVEPTAAMIFGNLFHTYILEESSFEERYITIPDGAPKKPTKAQIYAKKPSPETIEAVEFWERFNKKNEGKEIIDQSDLILVQNMKEVLYKNEAAKDLMLGITETEKGLFWEDDVTGVEMKGKMDGNNDDYTIDLKTCENAHPDVFARHAYDLGYDRQGALYLDGRGRNKMKKGDFYFIAIEKSAPFGISINKASKDFIEQGRFRYGRILEDFAHWRMKGMPEVDYAWTANPFGYHELHLPPWVK